MRATAVSMLIRRAALVMVVTAAVLFLTVLPLRAQIDTGAVLGTVTDASGAEVRGATVTEFGTRFSAPVVVPDDDTGAQIEVSGTIEEMLGLPLLPSVRNVMSLRPSAGV